MRYLRINGKSFFRKYISRRPSVSTGGLELTREDYCIFGGKEGRCTIQEVRPLHCRFVPCPGRANDDEMMDRLFLGSGTVEQQFRHQVALAITREYVTHCGTEYDRCVLREIAIASVVTEMAKGKYPDDGAQITAEVVAEAVGGLADHKQHCSNLAVEALYKAIMDYVFN